MPESGPDRPPVAGPIPLDVHFARSRGNSDKIGKSKQWLTLAGKFGLTTIDRCRIDKPARAEVEPKLNIRQRT